MKKVFKIKTKNNKFLNSLLDYVVFAESLSEAIDKVQKVISISNINNEKIIEGELFCEVEEEKDLQEYIKERKEEEKNEQLE